MTLQTTRPLPDVKMSTMQRSLYWLTTFTDHSADGDYRLDLDQPYQRGDVWGPTRRRNLIRSLLMGVPIPSLIVNDRFGARFSEPGYDEARNWSYAVVDGKQRVTTYMMMLDGRLDIPASWLPAEDVATAHETADGPYVNWHGLTDVGRRGLQMRPMGVSEGRFRTLAAERAVFNLVNFGGLAQGERDEDA